MGLIRDLLNKILFLDLYITDSLAVCARLDSAYRPLMKHMELSMHGLPWFLFAICGFFYTRINSDFNVFFQYLLLVLILDVIVVGSLKALVRRTRPAYNANDMVATDSHIDIYSFPSGHATRATLISLVMMSLLQPRPLGCLIIAIYVIALAFSRVILGRHHAFDVFAGILIGVAEFRVFFVEYGARCRTLFSETAVYPQTIVHDALHTLASYLINPPASHSW